MSKVLIVAEHYNGALNQSTAQCVACATQIDNAEIDVVVLRMHVPKLPLRLQSWTV